MAITKFDPWPADIHVGSIQFWATMNKAAKNISVWFFVWTYVFISLG